MRLRYLLFVVGLALPGVALAGCGGDDNAAAAGADATVDADFDGEPAICLAFTEAGATCPMASPVRCFPLCEAGGCYCMVPPGGGAARWSCTTDLSCIPDCGPLDDGCAPAQGDDGSTGDDGPAEGSAGDDGGGDAGDAADGAADAPVDGGGTTDGGAADGSSADADAGSG